MDGQTDGQTDERTDGTGKTISRSACIWMLARDKNYKHWFTFAEVIVKIKVVCSFETGGIE